MAYTDRMDREAVIAAVRSRLDREPWIVAAWLFGSAARGTAGPSSDVDIAILGSGRPKPRRLADLPLDVQAELASALGREVDIVLLDDAPADLTHRVLRDGVLLIERDRAARLRFEVDARNRYFDMQPIWRTYRRGRGSAA